MRGMADLLAVFEAPQLAYDHDLVFTVSARDGEPEFLVYPQPLRVHGHEIVAKHRLPLDGPAPRLGVKLRRLFASGLFVRQDISRGRSLPPVLGHRLLPPFAILTLLRHKQRHRLRSYRHLALSSIGLLGIFNLFDHRLEHFILGHFVHEVESPVVREATLRLLP